MIKNDNKTWIDMTDLAVWEGRFTGIQRVVYNIAKRYRDKNTARYFYFDTKSKKFFNFDFDVFMLIAEKQIHENLIDDGIETYDYKQKIKNKAKNLYMSSPETLKKIATPERMKKMIKKSKKVADLGRMHLIFRPTGSVASEVFFSKNDTVLILGNTWDRPTILPEIGRLKQTNKFNLFQIVYDLIATFQPQAFNEELYEIYTKNLFEVATISDGLMAISNSTKKDMIRFCNELNIACPNIDVIRLGDDIPVSKKPTKPEGIFPVGEYVLCVGTIEARKNHALLYYAWKEGLRQGISMPRLVIAGRPGWYTQDIMHTFRNDPEITNYITILENTSDDELVWLYQKCKFTVYPSYYEGWGLPVAESLAMGKLCITTNVSSMPEIVKDLVKVHSPYDSKGLLELVSFYSSKSELDIAEANIHNNYHSFGWDDTFAQVNDQVSY